MLSRTRYLFYVLSCARNTADSIFARWYPKMRPEYRDLSQSTVIVTGANVGIGLEIARKLAEMNATVVLACRNNEKAEAARLDILQNEKVDAGKVEVLNVDCADLNSVRRFADNWGQRKLDILVNNAGMTNGKYKLSPQGFELTYATNMLSHYLLTNLLLPNINKYGRIVNVSSVGSYAVRKQLDVDDLDNKKAFASDNVKEGSSLTPPVTMQVYGRTKLMQIFFTREMQERLDRSDRFKDLAISVHSCHPGTTNSSIWERPEGFTVSWQKQLSVLAELFGVSLEQAACTPVHVAVSAAAFENKGMYWDRMAVRGANRLVEDKETRSKIWEKWIEESGLKPKTLL